MKGKVDYLPRALKALEDAPVEVRKALFKQIRFLEQNLLHPSLHAKEYDEIKDPWQARMNRDWRISTSSVKLTSYEISFRTLKNNSMTAQNLRSILGELIA